MLTTLIIAYVVIGVIFLASLALAAGQPIPEINPAELMDESLFKAATGIDLAHHELDEAAHPVVTENYHPVAS